MGAATPAGEGMTGVQRPEPLTERELRLMTLNPHLVGWSDVSRLIADLRASRAEVERLREALDFYADPHSYFAVMVMGDPPCGDFAYDWSEHGDPDFDPGDERPGRRAREALGGSPTLT